MFRLNAFDSLGALAPKLIVLLEDLIALMARCYCTTADIIVLRVYQLLICILRSRIHTYICDSTPLHVPEFGNSSLLLAVWSDPVVDTIKTF